MGRIYKTARGKSLDMASLIAKQEKTRAVSNINSINSRGDEIDQAGNVVRPNTQRVADSYASQVGTAGAVTLQERPENPNLSKSANPNAPLSPKQKRELEALEKEAKAHPRTPRRTYIYCLFSFSPGLSPSRLLTLVTSSWEDLKISCISKSCTLFGSSWL